MRGILALFLAIVVVCGAATIVAQQYLSEEKPASGTATSVKFVEVKDLSELEELARSFMEVHGGSFVAEPMKMVAAPPSTTAWEATGYSKTNVQVEGIEEADVVKTDGKYIYVARGSKLYIVKAYPPSEMKLVSELNFSTPMIEGIYLYGDRLVVLASTRFIVICSDYVEGGDKVPLPRPPIPPVAQPATFIYIYDISDKASPKLVANISVSGGYVASRMKNQYLYVLTQQPVIIPSEPETIVVPEVDGEPVKVWIPENKSLIWPPAMHTTIAVIDVETGGHEAASYVLGAASRIYMSKENLYIICTKVTDLQWTLMKKAVEIIKPHLPRDVRKEVDEASNPYEAASKVYTWLQSLPEEKRDQLVKEVVVKVKPIIPRLYHEETCIYRFDLESLPSEHSALGVVPGRVLEQFALHESKGYFMVATTVSKVYLKEEDSRYWLDWSSENCLYTLEVESMEIKGKLEGLAPGEQIYAARYLDGLALLVTYRQVDPLYGIDISDPANPKVLGYLKELGYSEYLHPYGDDRLIGVGVATNKEGRWLGVKVALYDISNQADIEKLSEVKVGDHTPALHDHHAFTLNMEKHYLLLPVEDGLAVVKIAGDKLGVKGIVKMEGAFRGLYIEGYIYAVGRGVVAADNSLKIVGEVFLD